MKHTHHIVPKHMGGTNHPSNLVEVTVEEHANLHLSLYLTHGLREDWVAFHMLSGQMGKEELQVQKSIMGGYNSQTHWTPEKRSAAASKGNTPEVVKQKSQTLTERHKECEVWHEFTEAERQLISEKTKEAQARMREEGRHIGRTKGSKNKNPYDASKRTGVKRGSYKRKEK